MSKMDVIKDVIIELRSRLRSCNVVLLTQPDFADQYHLKVCVRPNLIIVNYIDFDSKIYEKAKSNKDFRRDSTSSYESYSDSEDESFDYSKFIDVTSYCKLLPSSLSSLKIEQDFISFRIITEPIESTSSGTFFTEVINNVNDFSSNSECRENLLVFDKPSININQSDKSKLLCSNCLNCISITENLENNLLSFNRILELPSENLDMSEWFCHGPSGHNHSDKEESHPSENHSKFAPSKTDIFYFLSHFNINSANLKLSFLEFNKKRNVVHCDRCFFWLGVKHDKDNVKFWNSCIKFSKLKLNDPDSFKNVNLFSTNKATHSNISLDNFLYVIKYGIKNSFCSVVSSTCKLLLECKISNEKNQYILIWVMDKSLDILKVSNHAPNQSSDYDVKNVNQIQLKHIVTSKFLYKIDDDSDLVKSWMNDITVQHFEISKDMFLEGNKHFKEMTVYIPHGFRKTNDFFVTYLDI